MGGWIAGKEAASGDVTDTFMNWIFESISSGMMKGCRKRCSMVGGLLNAARAWLLSRKERNLST